MCRVEYAFDRREAMLLFALRDIIACELEIHEDAARIRPLLEQIVVLEEVVVPECRMRHGQGLHGRGILFHVIADARFGIYHYLIREACIAPAILRFVPCETFAE